MKKTLLFLSFLFITSVTISQKLTTTSAVASFDATTPIDKLAKSDNKTVIGSLDKTSGAVAFEAAVNNFSFANPTMQTHFNSERWMNSNAHPKISFTGKLNKLTSINFSKNGTYKTSATGSLNIKGVTKTITAPVTIKVTNGKITGTSSFTVKLADHNINGPQVESGKVARVVKATITAVF